MHTNEDYFRERAQREAIEASSQGQQRQAGSRVPGSDEEDAAIHASMAAGAGDSAPAIAAAVVPYVVGPDGAPAMAMHNAHNVSAGYHHQHAYGAPAMQQYQQHQHQQPDGTAQVPLANAATYVPIAQAQMQHMGQYAQAPYCMPPQHTTMPDGQSGAYHLPTAVADVDAGEPSYKKQRNDVNPSMMAAFQAAVDDA